MSARTKFQLGLIVVAAAIGALMSSCAGLPPLGRTQYCYWFTEPHPFNPSTTSPPPPPTTLVCLDEELGATTTTTSGSDTTTTGSTTTSTIYGYVAPVPAGTRVVK